MRIAFSGSANVGKSTLVEAFKSRWPMYTFPTKTYRDVIKENNLSHSSNTSDETQLLILNWMMEEQEKHPQGSKVVYDRCPWDNLAYTLLGNSKNQISDSTTAATISFVRESMRNLDIIFWIKRNPDIKIVKDDLRDVDESFIKESDDIFNSLYEHYTNDLENDVFYPKDDCPAIIPIDENFSSVDDRLMFVGEFINRNGDLIETDQSVLSPENLEIYEKILLDQEKEVKYEETINSLIKEFKK